MLRRINLFAICGLMGFCILLLIATSQRRSYSDMLSSLNFFSVGRDSFSSHRASYEYPLGSNIINSGFSFNEERFSSLVAQQTRTLYNMSDTIADILAAQRSRIATETEIFKSPNRAYQFRTNFANITVNKDEKLNNLGILINSTVMRSVIVTTWRSGSTFLGDILNAIPGTFYHYEPLLNFGIQQIRNASDEKLAIKNLKNLLHCDYNNKMDAYLDYGKSHTYLFEHNDRLWMVCKDYQHLCWHARFLTPFCKLFPLQSMKTVRLRLKTAEQLLADEKLNVRIVLLVRDPRGTMQSRRHRTWCANNPDCEDAHLLCKDLANDYKTAEAFLQKYSFRFRTLRYEDLSLNPYEVVQDVLQFYGLPFHPKVQEFLDTHTKENIGGVSSTYRDSKLAPFHWKQDLKPEAIKYIQMQCKKAMNLWGYRRITNFTNYAYDFDPIILPPPFT